MHHLHSMLHTGVIIVVGTVILFAVTQAADRAQTILSGFWDRGRIRRFVRWGWGQLTTLSSAEEHDPKNSTTPLESALREQTPLDPDQDEDGPRITASDGPDSCEPVLYSPEDVIPASSNSTDDLRRAKDAYSQLMDEDPDCPGGHAYVAEIVERAGVSVETALDAIDLASL